MCAAAQPGTQRALAMPHAHTAANSHTSPLPEGYQQSHLESLNMPETNTDDLMERLKEAARTPATPKDRREFRISFIMSAVGRNDEATRREVEAYVDEHYGTFEK